jgi:hypothetical protein
MWSSTYESLDSNRFHTYIGGADQRGLPRHRGRARRGVAG